MNILDRVRLALKALTITLPTSSGGLVNLMPRTQYNYELQAGTGRQSPIIMACIRWVQRTFPEAPIILQHQEGTELERIIEHPLLTVLNAVNPYYDNLLLQSATVAELMLTGNAYWLKVRSAAGRVVELWWVPSSMLTPKWPSEGSVFISHYDYSPGYQTVRLAIEDVVHFRDGIDPNNIRLGLSPLKSLFREIFSDDEAANMTAALLKNLGVPGMVLSPDQGNIGSPADIEATKEWLKQHFTGDYRGEPLVMSGPTKVQPFTFSPQQLDLRSLRRIPEERISAVLGVPAIVAGLGAGLDRSTFSNMAEAREAAYESTIIPMQRAFASVLQRQLLPDFVDDPELWRIAYDLSEVKVLQEDANSLVTRTNQMVMGGYLKIVDAQRMTGSPVDETQDFYLRPFNLIPSSSGAVPSLPSKAQFTAWKEEVLLAQARRRPFYDEEAPKAQFKTLTEEGKEAAWRGYVLKAEGYEKLLIASLRAMFEAQRKDTIKQVELGNRDNPFGPHVILITSYKTAVTPILTELIVNVVEDSIAEVQPQKALKQAMYPAAIAWLKTRIGWAAEQTSEETANLLGHTLAEGYATGEGITELTGRVKSVFTFCSDYRAERIARTETIQASAQGQIVGYEEAGVRRLEFYAAVDERTCEYCMALHGEEFPVGESEGIITVHVNCRCRWLPVIE